MHFLADASDHDTANLIKIEMDGGPCPKCTKEWQIVTFANRYGSGGYFKPACECYPRCPRCSRELYEEFSSGILQGRDWRCDCGYQLWLWGADSTSHKKRHGSDWEQRYNAMDAFQQHRDAGGVKLS